MIILGYQLITGEKEVLSQLSCLTTSDLSIAVSVDVSIATDRVICESYAYQSQSGFQADGVYLSEQIEIKTT